MKSNKPEIKAYLISDKTQPKMRGVRLYEGYDPSLLDTRSDCEYEPMVLLSDYEALQAECESLRKASSELANWCFHGVGADIGLTPGLKQVMDITGDTYDSQ